MRRKAPREARPPALREMRRKAPREARPERGREEGRERGREKGRERGREEGWAAGVLSGSLAPGGAAVSDTRTMAGSATPIPASDSAEGRSPSRTPALTDSPAALTALSGPATLNAARGTPRTRRALRPCRRDQRPRPIRDVLQRLSPQHRAVLVLRDVEGLDEQAAAAVLDVPLGTMRSRLSRARGTFRKAWEQ